jgi:alkanesulfonate monooxygenase SsuD/methylene tetrahydromethanopterin reductase-like flavin-dependent oxidoreductase (luciferase family)
LCSADPVSFSRVQFSFWPSNERPWDETLELAQWAEQSGLLSFWFADHFMSQPDDDITQPGEDPALECWTVLTALGALVPRLRLVSMVSPVTIHHPVVLAKRVATLDLIAPARVVLGLGAGWQENEHTAYGFELASPGRRVDRFAEAIEVVHKLLNHDRSEYSGRYYTLTDAAFVPRPNRLPMLVGTAGPRMLRLTARFADEWNTWGDPDLVGVRTASFIEACEQEGRDPATVHRSAQAMIFLTKDDATRDKLKARVPAGRSLVGGVNELIDLLAAYRSQGLDEFAIPDFTLGSTAQARRDVLETLRTEVLPALS